MGWEGFASDVQAAEKSRGPRCSVGKMLDDLTPSVRGAVLAVLDDGELSSLAIHRALRDRLGDRAPSGWSIGHHRRGKCRCGR